ncbi:alpha/beta hydrolase [Nocardioides aurantiacus]|uniref:Alpha/beta hydrolase family protein n=1 Tax=Nocardioides aurantiacus TaxID=86796 RepID=A0A3N2CP45_9ACTN|nr:alpha/beta hydrolase [Nocardioides aurantiacus]ROR89299.1 alpha/beta hydrolase family protein [Nocardioides aurantiacus]
MTGALPDATLRWADHDDGVLDVHLPGGRLPRQAARTVLLVHGGFWKSAHDRRHTREQARALADLGWVVATPEYRRVGAGGGWPTTGRDVRRALDLLPELLGRIGVRSGPTWAMGHSAGGQLVLWLAATGAPLDGVVALAPVADLAEALRLDLGDGATAALLGDQPVGEADPVTLLDRRPPYDVRVVHGSADEAVPLPLSRGLVERHPWIDLTELDTDHMSLIDPGSDAWPTVVAQLPG